MDTLKTDLHTSRKSKRLMNEQKDTQKTGVESYGQTDSFGFKNVTSNGNYDHAQKKTNKLITALYMVTDCMEVDDPIKSKLRSLGVELMSDTYALSLLSPTEKQTQVIRSLARIHEVISLIEIGKTIGFISEMNTAILKREFLALSEEWKSFQKIDSHFSFTLDEQLLSVPEAPAGSDAMIKDSTVSTFKRTESLMSFIPKSSNPDTGTRFKKTLPNGLSLAEKNNRTQKILDMIKDRKDLPAGEAGVSIKDISTHFNDCSEKTIQRELNVLVAKGTIKRLGAKRWSKYQIQ